MSLILVSVSLFSVLLLSLQRNVLWARIVRIVYLVSWSYTWSRPVSQLLREVWGGEKRGLRWNTTELLLKEKEEGLEKRLEGEDFFGFTSCLEWRCLNVSKMRVIQGLPVSLTFVPLIHSFLWMTKTAMKNMWDDDAWEYNNLLFFESHTQQTQRGINRRHLMTPSRGHPLTPTEYDCRYDWLTKFPSVVQMNEWLCLVLKE